MVRSKETFEHWSTKKRPKHAHSTRAKEGTSKEVEMASPQRSERTQIDSQERLRGKGMKRTLQNPNSKHIPSTGMEEKESPMHMGADDVDKGIDFVNYNLQDNEVAVPSNRLSSEIEEVVPIINNGMVKSLEFSKLHMKEKPEVVGKGVLPELEEDSRMRGKQRQQYKGAKPGSIEDRIISKDPEKVREKRIHRSQGTSSQRPRSWSSSSTSSAQAEYRRKGQSRRSKPQSQSWRSLSSDEVFKGHSHMRQPSRADCKRSSTNANSRSKGREERRKKRHRCKSGSDNSDHEKSRHLNQQRSTYEGRSWRHHGSYEGNSEEHSQSPMLLSESETEHSKESRGQRQYRHIDVSNSSGSELPIEVDDVALVEVKSETTLRKKRRDRQKDRERRVRGREKQGQKVYYLHVNHNGKPYGDGVTAWKADLNKLAKGLDPSVMDVREQPPTEMSTLRRHLRQNFEYSHPVDPIFIRQLVGRAVTQWRTTLWKKIDAEESCPKGFDADIWSKLEKTRSCPSHAEKSERMKHANSCRITLGRTGPRGEDGIREHLRLEKGISPDYDDVFTEMQRDKGYGGKAAEKKALKKTHGKVDVKKKAGVLWESLPLVTGTKPNQSMCQITSRASTVEVVPIQDEFVQGLQSKIAELEAAMAKILKGAMVFEEEPSGLNTMAHKVTASRSKQLSVEEEDEACVGQRDSSKGRHVLDSPGHFDAISRRGPSVSDGQRKLRSQKG